MEAPMENKTFQYTVTFTVETSRRMEVEDLEEKAAAVWDGVATSRDRELFTDSYNFIAEKR
jgi:hypothetical protein